VKILLQILASVPNITDWMSAISATVGIPLVIITLYKLLAKDKEKEKRLKAIESIAISQNEVVEKLQGQINELANQTSEFQRQTSLMADANLLLEKQLELQADIYLDSKGIEEKKLEIEEKKRLADIKPYFRYYGGISNPRGFTINFINEGGDATINGLDVPVDCLADFREITPKLFKKGEKMNINGHANSNTYFNGNQVPFNILLKFLDEDKNQYTQSISRTRNGSITISPAILAE
jgi:uncharacterized coiled-coil protein SlyX